MAHDGRAGRLGCPGIRSTLSAACFYRKEDERRANDVEESERGSARENCDQSHRGGAGGRGRSRPACTPAATRAERPVVEAVEKVQRNGGEHLEREEGGVAQSLAFFGRGEPGAARQRNGKRRADRSPRLHPDESSRRRQGSGHRRPVVRRHDLPGAGASVRRGDGSGDCQGRPGPLAGGDQGRHVVGPHGG